MLKLVKLKENNNINIVNKINDFKNPSHIYIPVFNKEDYKLNDYVYKNTRFGKYISSISGYITGTRKILLNNKPIETFEIENDFKENTLSKKRIKKITNIDDLVTILEEYSLNTIINKILNVKNINYLIISSIDEEEYSLKEFLRLSKNYTEILETLDYLIHLFNISNGIIATKSTNFKSIKNVKSIIGTYPNIKITLVPDKYLISYKDFLCEYLNLNKEETLVLTTNELYDVYNILKKGKDITENLITISGDALNKSLVINVRLNTSLEEILGEYIKITTDKYEVYINGYLKGTKINDINDIIITKDIHSIVINKLEEIEESVCINCGACQKICPFNINVKRCYLNKYSHRKCIGCGLCDYICPAKIKLKNIVMSDDNEKL